jgi:hypothetical protein
LDARLLGLDERAEEAEAPAMRMLGSAFNWPPDHVDELAALLGRVGQANSTVARQADTRYELTTAVAELDEWLDVFPSQPSKSGGSSDRRSMLADVGRAFDMRGPRVVDRTPSAVRLMQQLEALADASGGSAEAAITELQTLRTELIDPDTGVAAFEDLAATVEAPHSPAQVINARLAVLGCTLELSDRPVAEVCDITGGIIDDQALEIDLARHDLDGTIVQRHEKVDEQAGLSIDERLQLARRYLQHAAQAGQHVVWLTYRNARLPAPGWRQQVGRVEFFDGPTMINTIGNTKDHVGTLLPDELLKPSSEGGLADDSGWPKTNDLRWWVAARVDLGEGQFSNPVRIAKEQADSIVQLARFPRPEEPIWEPLGGHIHLIDGIARSRQRVRRNGSQDHFWAEHDKTGHELLQLAATVGPHLPVVNPLLRRILGVVTTLNLSANSLEPDLLTHDVRALELISRQCEQPDWEGFLIQNNATAHAHDRALNEVYDTVSSVLHDPMLLIPDAAEFRAQIYYRDEKSQRMMLDRGAALALIAKLVNLVPDHNMNARKLRDVARRTQSVHDVGNWVSELMAEYRVKIARWLG